MHLDIGPAGGPGNAKSVRRAPGLLANAAFCEFCPVCPAEFYISRDPDALRSRSFGCGWDDTRIGAGLGRSNPHLAAADAPSRRGAGRLASEMSILKLSAWCTPPAASALRIVDAATKRGTLLLIPSLEQNRLISLAHFDSPRGNRAR